VPSGGLLARAGGIKMALRWWLAVPCIGVAGVAAFGVPPLLEFHRQRQAEAWAEQHEATATEDDGRVWARDHFARSEAECPRRNPTFVAGCMRQIRERLAQEQAELARRQAAMPTEEEMVAGMVRRMESGEEAGYEWAQSRGIIDESSCENDSSSFASGCSRYVEERARQDSGVTPE